MCALFLPSIGCVLWFGTGMGLAIIANYPVGWFLEWLRLQSRIAGTRPVEEVGVPPLIVGSFERLLAFFLVVFDVEGTATLLAAWLGAKLAASWQRVAIDANDYEAGRQVRAGALSAHCRRRLSSHRVLIGLFVRRVCQ